MAPCSGKRTYLVARAESHSRPAQLAPQAHAHVALAGPQLPPGGVRRVVENHGAVTPISVLEANAAVVERVLEEKVVLWPPIGSLIPRLLRSVCRHRRVAQRKERLATVVATKWPKGQNPLNFCFRTAAFLSRLRILNEGQTLAIKCSGRPNNIYAYRP